MSVSVCVCVSAIGSDTSGPIELKFCRVTADYTGKVIGYVMACCWLRFASCSKKECLDSFWSRGEAFSRKVYYTKVVEHPQKWWGGCSQI